MSRELINEVDVWGCADPREYPNPVLVDRGIYAGLRAIQSSGKVDMADWAAVQACAAGGPGMTIGDYRSLGVWLGRTVDGEMPNRDLYLAGIGVGPALEPVEPRGFHVRMYRASIEFTDKSVVVFRESPDGDAMKRYMADLKATYESRGWIVRAQPDRGLGIFRIVKDAATGEPKETLYSVLRLAGIKPTDRTPLKDQRFPDMDTQRIANSIPGQSSDR